MRRLRALGTMGIRESRPLGNDRGIYREKAILFFPMRCGRAGKCRIVLMSAREEEDWLPANSSFAFAVGLVQPQKQMKDCSHVRPDRVVMQREHI